MEPPVFVARKTELEQLDRFLDQALAAQGLVCWVTGEAGSGKTALVTEFARRAQEKHADLVMAVGQSDAQTGAGDPYLPFCEMLGQLTGDVEAKLAQGAITSENAGRLRKVLALSCQALVDVGPDLVGVFVPGVGLATRVGAFVAEKVGWLDKLEKLARPPREGEVPMTSDIKQSHVFEQYTKVMTRLAEKNPLILVLDDLQWADAASISLLFRLGRRIGGSRILIVGTFRPEEVALGRRGERHPLEKVLAEFKRYHGDNRVDLDRSIEAEGRRFVDAFLATEPNGLGRDFREALYFHTGGHPLFTIELLRSMQERGDLVRDGDGRWVAGPHLDWNTLPPRVEGVIEERVGRLEDALQQALTIGSVEGEDFTAEVVAGVQAAEARELIRLLSAELEKRHRLVGARGVRRTNGRRLSMYRFQHNLIQKHLYGGLDDVQRAYLHEDVATVLEELYGDRVDEIAVQLARHYVEAGIPDRARLYLRSAGEQAAGRYANDEAVDYFTRCLDLIPEDGMPGNAAERYALLQAREKVYDLQGARLPQKADLLALEALAEAMDDDRERAIVALRHSVYAESTRDLPGALAHAQAAVGYARAAQDKAIEAEGCAKWGVALLGQGEYEACKARLEESLSLARYVGSRILEAHCLLNLGNACYRQGDYAAARTHYEECQAVHQETGIRRGQGSALGNLGIIHMELGDIDAAQACFERALEIFSEIGDRPNQGIHLNNLGLIFIGRGAYDQAQSCYEQTLEIFDEIGSQQGVAHGTLNLGTIFAKQGFYGHGRTHFERALSLFRELADRHGQSETLCNLSLLCHSVADYQAARQHAQDALQIAQDLGARSVQAGALTNLGHALVALGHPAEAVNAYRQALNLRREAGLAHLAVESLSGLAEASLALGDVDQASAQAEEVLSYLHENPLESLDDPFRVYLACYRVLRATRDSRAPEVLRTAYNLLQQQAVKITGNAMRLSFLENVPAHAEIVREFARAQ